MPAPRPVVVAAGNRIDGAKRSEARFPPSQVDAVAEAIRTVLAELAPRAVVAAAAAGADLLVLQAADELRVPYHVVLPLPVEVFRRTSVDDQGPAWTEAFDLIIRRASSVRTFHLSGRGAWHLRGNELILNEAARVAGDGNVAALVVNPVPLAGSVTADLASRASLRGWPLVQIDPGTARRITDQP